MFGTLNGAQRVLASHAAAIERIDVLKTIFANGLEHGEPAVPATGFGGCEGIDQAVVEQDTEPLETIDRFQGCASLGHGGGIGKGEGRGEDGEAMKQSLGIGREQPMTPVDGVVQAAEALGLVLGAATEEGESVIELGNELGGLEQAEPGGGELKGKGQAIEAAAEGGDVGGGGISEIDGGVGGMGPAEQELNGGKSCHFTGGERAWWRNRQGEQGKGVLAGGTDEATACGNDGEPWAFGEKRNQLGRHAFEVFQIVQHEDGWLEPKRRGQGVRQVLGGRLLGIEGSGNDREQCRGIGNGGERHEPPCGVQ
jgi:hypothetical protein